MDATRRASLHFYKVVRIMFILVVLSYGSCIRSCSHTSVYICVYMYIHKYIRTHTYEHIYMCILIFECHSWGCGEVYLERKYGHFSFRCEDRKIL